MSSVLKPVKGLVALVTGGASGLGRATVEHLHKAGAKVALLDIPQSAGADIVNVIGTLNVIRHSAALFFEKDNQNSKDYGIIINTASIAAYDGQIGQVAYAASKGAIVSLTLPLARDFADSGIRVMTLAPGIFETPILQGLPTKVQAFLKNLVPNPNRLGRPEEFAALVQHCIENTYLNGEVIRIDGSLRMPP